LAKRILANPDLVLFQPPEGKGRLLRNLCYEYGFSFEETQEDAIIAVLKTIQTWQVYKEVMEHLASDGRRIKNKPASGPDDIQCPSGNGGFCPSSRRMVNLNRRNILNISRILICHSTRKSGERCRFRMDTAYKLGDQTLWDFLDGAQKEQYRYHRLRLFMERCNRLSKKPSLHAAAIRDNGILSA
jgi:hypothetical protein